MLAIPVEGLGADERIALTCLQGLLARQQPRLWLIRQETDRFWLERHRLRGFIKSYEVETNWSSLFQRFAPSCQGAVIPDPNLYRGDLIAANVAACEDAIVAPPDLATRLGLEVKVDLRGRFTNYADGLSWVWTRYRSRLNPQLCDFRQPELLSHCTFDYSYEFRSPMFWIAGPMEAQRRGADPDREKKIVAEILAEMRPNGVCVGFPAGTQGDGYGIGETKGVELLSQRAYALVCNNWEANCSILSGVRVDRFKQPKPPAPPALDRRKIYIALYFPTATTKSSGPSSSKAISIILPLEDSPWPSAWARPRGSCSQGLSAGISNRRGPRPSSLQMYRGPVTSNPTILRSSVRDLKKSGPISWAGPRG